MPTALAKSTLSSRHSLPGPHGFATNSSSPSALSRESRAGARTVALDPGSRSLCSLVRGDGQREATEIYARRRDESRPDGGVVLSRCEHAPCSVPRSEEHTSELQSLMRISYAVFCLTKKHDN